MNFMISLLLFIGLMTGADAQTIEEKKAFLTLNGSQNPAEFLCEVNKQLPSLRAELEACYAEVNALVKTGAGEKQFQGLLQKVNEIRAQIVEVEEKWHALSLQEGKKEEEGYAMWDQEETTLSQLIMEYGASDFLYVIPTELSQLKLNMHSNIPIPRESWPSMLEILLSHNGIGVKKLNAYANQLFVLKMEPASVQRIIASPADLAIAAPQTRICYILSPPLESIRGVLVFFERFADAKHTFVYQVGRKIALVSSRDEVEKLLTLYNTIWEDPKGKVVKVISVTKMNAKEMEKILQSFFGEGVERSRPPFGRADQEGLSIHTLGQGKSLVLIGQQEVVDRAERLVRDTEDQLQDPSEMTVYLYPCRHSDPTDLSALLEKVYSSLLSSSDEGVKDVFDANFTAQGNPPSKLPEGYPPNVPPLVVPPPPTVRPEVNAQLEVNQGSDHFIPDPKTGTVLMVVRRDALQKIKDLLRRLDVPKKMVQIEVLLFERRLHEQNNFGLNLLKLGSKDDFAIFESKLLGFHHFKGEKSHFPDGVLQFFFSGHKSKHFPAFDIAYSFMMTQEDIQLNAAPSVITVNQTPATISIVEEISINNGAAPINTSSGQIAFEKSFSRAQYGITIVITPTIHVVDPSEAQGEEKGFVTLQTNITFDTTKPSLDDRPLVDKRHIENEVRVVDGQTVILGGLRRKTSHDTEEKIPFLGEIPGIGKLFGATRLTDSNTEMIFFITPKIVLDAREELIRLRTDELKIRPGDLPEFLEKVAESREKDRKRFFVNSLKVIMGP